MKKFLFGLFGVVALSLAAVSFSSCGDDDPVDNPSGTTNEGGEQGGNQGGGSSAEATNIVGKWAYSEDGRCASYLDITSSEISYMYCGKSVEFKDGVLYASQAKWDKSYTFHYTVKNGKIVVKEYSGITFFVKDGKLHEVEDGEDEVYTKIKEMK